MKPRQNPQAFTIAGKRWQWRYRPMRSYHGLCDYTARTITIDTDQAGKTRLDSELHEALHAIQAFATEEHAAEAAATLTEIIWRLGYRLTEAADKRRVYVGE
jgi:hypothetical protein